MTDKAKLKVAIQALKDMLDPIGKMRRELPEGYKLDGHFAVQYADSPQCYRAIAAEALQKIEATTGDKPCR